MKLFFIHAGYYDSEIGVYELHTNFIVAAANIMSAKTIIMEKEIFKRKNMHIDAVEEIDTVDGYQVILQKDQSNITKIISYNYAQIKQLA